MLRLVVALLLGSVGGARIWAEDRPRPTLVVLQEAAESLPPGIPAEDALPESLPPADSSRHVDLRPLESCPTPHDQSFDPYYYDSETPWAVPAELAPLDGFGRAWCCQFLPDGLMYRSYLAGVKEPRFSGVWVHEKDLGWKWDITLGGRVGILRYGTQNSFRPEGWQIDVEGAAFPRLDLEEDHDMDSADFRFGVPLTYALGRYETKLAFYHLSAHVADEFLLKNPSFVRVNFSRDVIVLGGAMYPSDDVRLYFEAGYATNYSGGTEPWEFQFGIEFSPACPTGFRGLPFAAVNAYLREEFDFGGTLTAQAGWQWRGRGARHLFRLGLQYLNGKSPQFEFFNESEQQIGLGMWYDY